MKILVEIIKNTLLGGIIFLLPLGIIILISGELFSALDGISDALGDLVFPHLDLPILSGLITTVILLTSCFFAGLLAKTRLGMKITTKLDSQAIKNIPGYGIIRQIIQGTSSLPAQMDDADRLRIVKVNLGSSSRFGVVGSQPGDQDIVVFLPSAPSVFKGIVVIVKPEQITDTSMTLGDLMGGMNSLGRGLIGGGRG